MTRLIAFLLFFLPGLAAAQNYPDYQDTKINDLAGLITRDTESRLHEALTVLNVETGIEATVLTVKSWRSYGGHPDFESFATGLFNHWGIGDASTNNGILILVAGEEHDLRVELGQGYGDGYNRIAGELVVSEFLPHFRNFEYDAGIERGTRAVIEQIAAPFSQGIGARADTGGDADVPGASSGGSGFGIVAAVIAAFVALLVFLKKKFGIANQSCPTCNKKTLSRSSEVLRQPTRIIEGRREDTTRCSACGYLDTSVVTLSRLRDDDSRDGSDGDGGSFGGGSSSGGGASGKW